MDSPRPEKVAVVDEVRHRLSSSNAALLTEYRGLSVTDLAHLRRGVRQAGAEFKIYKNTLVRLAVRDLGLNQLEQFLTGPTAMAFVFGGDAAEVAKVLRDFARGKPALVVKGGLLGEHVLSASETGALAELPSREVLLGRLAGALAAPMQRLASLLVAVPQRLAYGLAALLDQRSAEGSQTPPDEVPEVPGPSPASEAGPSGADDPDPPEHPETT